jgi:type 1 fimbriae regulatory protein FimE
MPATMALLKRALPSLVMAVQTCGFLTTLPKVRAAVVSAGKQTQGIPRVAKPVSTNVKPKVPPKRRLHLRPDEAQRLIEAAGQRGRHRFRDRVLVRFVYRHGMRASEATGLRWEQFDLASGTVHVQRLKGSVASTHSMDRDELRDLRKLKKESTSPYVFVSELGGPLSVDALQYIVREAGKLAKIEVQPVHPHMLRHAAGYCLINAGNDVRIVQDFLGHKSLANTARYTALAPARLAAVRVR